ncbi:hypothetical protein EUGRSUZ_K00170 [Eucalyptus grandis]|uniref:Uncharacterized protein n=2 Tax=Eucalyptus grandis TaxID=71139 RepID=A0ACC3IQS7_EUCGR|nr:hypothetical protein EUGRSUZ_K00170 [Eucalyptus grandis]
MRASAVKLFKCGGCSIRILPGLPFRCFQAYMLGTDIVPTRVELYLRKTKRKRSKLPSFLLQTLISFYFSLYYVPSDIAMKNIFCFLTSTGWC